jgi:hypothetical protein
MNSSLEKESRELNSSKLNYEKLLQTNLGYQFCHFVTHKIVSIYSKGLGMEKPFVCPVPSCEKMYKNANGLKYHAQYGHSPRQQ